MKYKCKLDINSFTNIVLIVTKVWSQAWQNLYKPIFYAIDEMGPRKLPKFLILPSFICQMYPVSFLLLWTSLWVREKFAAWRRECRIRNKGLLVRLELNEV